MLAVSVELLHGVVRAASVEELAAAGSPSSEWPPSPARLFAALVAGGGTRNRSGLGDDAELRAIERAAPPRIVADGAHAVLETTLVGRYVVSNAAVKNSAKEYVARTSTLVQPGVRCAPRTPVVTYVWDDLALGDDELARLRARAGRIGYLGCADSPVRVTVSTAAPQAESAWEPDPGATTYLPVPFDGSLEVLDAIYDDFSNGGTPRRAWYRSELQAYRDPSRHPEPPVAGSPRVIWLRFGASTTGRQVVLLTETLKAAALDRYQRDIVDRGLEPEVPAVLHGHGFEGRSGYHLAQWIALPDVAHRHATGRIHGAAVVFAADTPEPIVATTRLALGSITTLHVPGRSPISMQVYGGEPQPYAARPDTWSVERGTTKWASVYPVVFERRRRRLTIDDVNAWCRHAGVPDVADFEVFDVPLFEGAPRLSPSELTRHREDTRPSAYLIVEFTEPVRGPVVLGRARQFGLGLMRPLRRNGS